MSRIGGSPPRRHARIGCRRRGAIRSASDDLHAKRGLVTGEPGRAQDSPGTRRCPTTRSKPTVAWRHPTCRASTARHGAITSRPARSVGDPALTDGRALGRRSVRPSPVCGVFAGESNTDITPGVDRHRQGLGMNPTLSIGGRSIGERRCGWSSRSSLSSRRFRGSPRHPWVIVAMATSPIVPVAAVGGLLAVLVAQLRRVHSPRRARLWAATTWWVAFGPLVLLWYVAVGSLPVDGPLFVLVAALAVVGVFGIAAGLAVVLLAGAAAGSWPSRSSRPRARRQATPREFRPARTRATRPGFAIGGRYRWRQWPRSGGPITSGRKRPGPIARVCGVMVVGDTGLEPVTSRM